MKKIIFLSCIIFCATIFYICFYYNNLIINFFYNKTVVNIVDDNALHFNFTNKETDAALFEYDDKVWIFFGHQDLDESKKEHINSIARNFNLVDFSIESLSEGLLISFNENLDFSYKLAKEDDNWVLFRYHDDDYILTDYLIPKYEGNIVYFDHKTDGLNIYRIDDAKNFPMFYIVTSIRNKDTMSLERNYKHLFLDIQTSILGVVAIPKLNQVDVKLLPNTILFSFPSKKGINLNGDHYQYPIFNFKEWFYNSEDDFSHGEGKLLEIINVLEGYDQYNMMLNLFKFYMSHGVFDQATNYAEYIMKKYGYLVTNDLYFNILYAGSLFLADKYQESYTYFNNIDLTNLDSKQLEEITLWKNFALLFKTKNPVNNFDFTTDYTKTVLADYVHSKNFFIPLFNVMSEEKILNNSIISLQKSLQQNDLLNSLDKNSILRFSSKVLLDTNNLVQALEIWNYLANIDNDKHSRAYAIINLIKNTDINNISNLIKDFDFYSIDNLSLLWRNNDELEGEMLKFLMEYAFKEQDYYRSLSYADFILSNIPYYSDILTVFAEVDDIFFSLIDDEFINDLDKVRIFIAFSKLIPMKISHVDVLRSFLYSLNILRMDSYILKLQDAILSVRTSDFIKKRLVLTLYPIFKRQENYTQFLDIIDSYTFLDRDIDIIHLKTEIFLDLKDYKSAWETIEDYDTDRAIVLKARALWENEMYDEYIDLLESNLEYRFDPDRRLDYEQQKTILRLSFAYLNKNYTDNIHKLYNGFMRLFTVDDLRKKFENIYHISQSYNDNRKYIQNLYSLTKD